MVKMRDGLGKPCDPGENGQWYISSGKQTTKPLKCTAFFFSSTKQLCSNALMFKTYYETNQGNKKKKKHNRTTLLWTDKVNKITAALKKLFKICFHSDPDDALMINKCQHHSFLQCLSLLRYSTTRYEQPHRKGQSLKFERIL